MDCNVLYEIWEMECCGIPFSAGDKVRWLVSKAGKLITPIDLGEIDYCYDAHSSDVSSLLVLEGKVETVKILYQRYAASKEDLRVLVPIDGKLIDTETAEGFDDDIDDMKASSYIISLTECMLRPAREEDVSCK